MEIILGLLVIALGLAFYFLPALIGREKRNAGSIFALNLFLGWTLVGWVVALVWALSNDSPTQVRVVNRAVETQSDVTDKLFKLKKLLDDGVLTQEEYDQQKKKLLEA